MKFLNFMSKNIIISFHDFTVLEITVMGLLLEFNGRSVHIQFRIRILDAILSKANISQAEGSL